MLLDWRLLVEYSLCEYSDYQKHFRSLVDLSFCSLGCAVAAICIGPNTVAVANCIHEIPIWSFRWWLISSGDGIDEMTGQEPEPDDQYSIVGHGSFTSLFSELK